MGRIKIDDLPKEIKISKKEMRAITGAGLLNYNYKLMIPPDPFMSLDPALGGFRSKMVIPPDPIRVVET